MARRCFAFQARGMGVNIISHFNILGLNQVRNPCENRCGHLTSSDGIRRPHHPYVVVDHTLLLKWQVVHRLIESATKLIFRDRSPVIDRAVALALLAFEYLRAHLLLLKIKGLSDEILSVELSSG